MKILTITPYELFLNLKKSRNMQNEEISFSHLSSRELTIFKYLYQGYRNYQIANILNISEKTVSTYKRRLMEKLNCSTMSSLILIAHKNNGSF